MGWMAGAQEFRWNIETNSPEPPPATVSPRPISYEGPRPAAYDSPPATRSNDLTARSVDQGMALYYADYLNGEPTAYGEIYRLDQMTAAHKTLPLGTLVKVTRIDNGASVTVRINDRGPFCEGCIIDLSRVAAEQLDLLRIGKTRVSLQIVGSSTNNPPAPVRRDLVARGADAVPAQYNAPTANNVPTSYDAPIGYGASRTGAPQGSIIVNPTGRDMVVRSPQATNAPASYSTIQTSPQLTARSVSQPTEVIPPAAGHRPEEVFILSNPIKGYAVQLGSYRTYANAERHVVALQKRGFDQIFVYQEKGSSGETLHRVIVAPFLSTTEAKNYLNDLREFHQLDGIVVHML